VRGSMSPCLSADGHKTADRLGARCLAVALAPDVTVNCIAPGFVEGTRMGERLPQAMKEQARAQAVLGRTASPDDIAQMAVAYRGHHTVPRSTRAAACFLRPVWSKMVEGSVGRV
jgi:NAD(P)-dependent dehydrogenase (short-subunit alcohol dehydrogenase family)